MADKIASQLDNMSIDERTTDGSFTMASSVDPSASGGSAPSPGRSDHSSLDSDAKFNPMAMPFMPAAGARPEIKPLGFLTPVEQRPSPNAGKGLFATRNFPRGSLVISETPLLSIDLNASQLVWGPYCRLNNADKAFYDSLHSHEPESMDLKMVARAHLIDYADGSLDSDNIDELVLDQARVMGVFAVNNFQKPGRQGLHMFKLISRINHSCFPNAFHSFNPTLGRMMVHAIRDINAGDEIFTSYLGADNGFMVRSQRVEKLRSNYGFTCQCPACTDTTQQSDFRREYIHEIHNAVRLYLSGTAPGSQTLRIPSPKIARIEMKCAIEMMLNEGLMGMELARAWRLASAVALDAKDFDAALDFACYEAVVERNCMGIHLEDLVASGNAAVLWIEHVQCTALNSFAPGSSYQPKKHYVNPSFAYWANEKKKAEQKANKKRRVAFKRIRMEREEYAAAKLNDGIQRQTEQGKGS